MTERPPKTAVTPYVARIAPNWETVRLVDGTLFPAWAEVVLAIEGPRPVVEVRLVEDGMPVVGYVKVARGPGGAAVTAADYRWLPFTELVNAATRAAATVAHLHGLGDAPIADAEYTSAIGRAGAIGQRYKITDRFLREVAAIVAENPTGSAKVVADRKQTSERNASRWIAAARDRGLITGEES
jgi:hypothetical protein